MKIYIMIKYLLNGNEINAVLDMDYDRLKPIVNTKKAILNGTEIEILSMKRI